MVSSIFPLGFVLLVPSPLVVPVISYFVSVSSRYSFHPPGVWEFVISLSRLLLVFSSLPPMVILFLSSMVSMSSSPVSI